MSSERLRKNGPGDAGEAPVHLQGEIRESVEEAFRREEIAGELKLAGVALVICAVGQLFAFMTVLQFHRGWEFCLVPVGYAGYYFAVIMAIRRGWYRPWIKYLSSTLEVSAAMIVDTISFLFFSPEAVLIGPTSSLYFLAVGATALRFRKWLSFYAGTLAAIQSTIIYFLMYPRLPSGLVSSLPSLSESVYLQRSGYLFLAGVLAAVVSNVARRLVRSIVSENVRWQDIRRMFGRYVSDQVVEEVLDRGLVTGGELREITVLCSDVRNFTSFSSGRSPEKVVSFLNALFERQNEVVERHGGRVDKFLGDGMLAVFGAPVVLDDHPARAARAALEIASLRRAELPGSPEDLQLGVALHTGQVVVGNVGSRERLDYTVIGDTVNLAFGIEGLNRRFGTSVLVSEETRARLGGQAVVTRQPACLIRGREEEIRSYELRGFGETG